MSQKRARSPSAERTTKIFKSFPIEDRSSKFIAVFSPDLSSETLRALPDFQSASHLMTAWRSPAKQRSLNSQPLFDTGYDDDGEKYGGKTLENVLRAKEVLGALMVVRWYGGIMLGPVRFDHIRNCANDAVLQYKQENENVAKRAKADMTRSQLITALPERDQRIAVLRALLSEKKYGSSSSGERPIGLRSEAPNYAGMELAALERLEQVRDKTIEWILAQIDVAEKAKNESSTAQVLQSGEADFKQTSSSNAAQLSGEIQIVPETSAKSADNENINAIGKSQNGPTSVSPSQAATGERGPNLSP